MQKKVCQSNAFFFKYIHSESFKYFETDILLKEIFQSLSPELMKNDIEKKQY